MKIRKDFVTNSSSSSFICIYEINDCEEFRKQLKEQLGNVGLQLADTYLKKGKDWNHYSDGTTELHNYINDKFDNEKTYFKSIHYTYSDDPDDFNQPSNFLEDYIPKEFVTLIYESED